MLVNFIREHGRNIVADFPAGTGAAGLGFINEQARTRSQISQQALDQVAALLKKALSAGSVLQRLID